MDKVFTVPKNALLICIFLVILSGLSSICLGAAQIPPIESLKYLLDLFSGQDQNSRITEIDRVIILEWRLPRFVLGFLVGASLAIAGAGFQGVFRNPLADPFLLGSAAGAGLGATLVIVTSVNLSLGFIDSVQIGAFIGAMGAVLCAASISASAGRTPASLLLAGVATAAFLTACQTYIMQRNFLSIQEIFGWLIGRLLTSGWTEVLTLAPYFLICFTLIYVFSKELDLLRLSEDEAKSLGGNPTLTYIVVITCSTLVTAVAVSLSGLIAFVGLVIPHIIRLTVSSSYRVIIPLSALGGGTFLTLADTFSRTVIAPGELPIGVITAFLGAPFFAFLLRLSRGTI